jgi:glucose-6-phosphate 1-dehydrogenase
MTRTATSRVARPAPPGVMVIFGAGGDLAKRKLIPALYHLTGEKLLSQHFAVIALARHDHNDDSYREYLDTESRRFLGKNVSEELWRDLLSRVHYLNGDFMEADT